MNRFENRVREIASIALGTESYSMTADTHIDGIRYDSDTVPSDMLEGIYAYNDEDDEFGFDWEEDDEDDIILLKSNAIHINRASNPIHYYGYEFNWDSEYTRRLKNRLIKYIKSNVDDENVLYLIRDCVDAFNNRINLEQFDYMVVVPSSSRINKTISSEIGNMYNIPQIPMSKIKASEMKIDWEKIKSETTPLEYAALKQQINQIAKSFGSQSEDASITKIKPKFRKYIEPIIRADKESIDNIGKLVLSKHILVIDDVKTTGHSVGDVMKVVNDLGYKGDYTLLTLIQN